MTRYCPNCRHEFMDWVEKCLDCGTELIDTKPEPQTNPESPIININDTRYTTDPLVMIAEYTNFVDAKLGKDILESEGIQSFVPDEDANTFSWTGITRPIRAILVVRVSDSEKALKILRNIEKDNPEIRFPELSETDDLEPDDADTHD